ncbi:hypothetical protein BDV06DRAFT_216083 [Aspergillus oleicola]
MPPSFSTMEGSMTHRFRVQRKSPEPLVFSRLHGNSSSPGSSRTRGGTASRPACDRCRRLKKRCSRAVPDCAACVHAGRKCSYQVLQARVQELTQYVADIQQGRYQEQEQEQDMTPGQILESRALETETPRWNANASPAHTPVTIPAHLETPDSSVLVDAFFHHVYRAYPFIDEERVRRASLARVPDFWDTDSMILYMIMAIGYTSLQRSGKAPPGMTAGFEIPYADIMQRCVMNESIDSIQVLVLLALYSLFDPRGPSTWSIVGIITRQAMAQGLTRPNTGEDLPPKTIELRRRLFWSIFGLDRMIAVSVGASPDLTGDEMDVPFPAITVEEFASEKRAEHASMLQVSRHVIELRQLESKIMAIVHHQRPMAVSALTQADRNTITMRLRSGIENWYSHGCLISRPEVDNVRLHDTMGWLNARYYHLLLILYYPCQFNSGTTTNGATRVTALLELVRKFSQYNRVLLSHQQLPLNRVTLSRLFPPCLILVHCIACGVESIAVNMRNEIRAFTDILDSFPSSWTHARRLARILLELDDLISGHEAYPMEATREEWIRSIRHDLVSLLGEALGKASCYQDIIDHEEQDSTNLSYTRAADESPNMSAPAFPAIDQDASTIVCSFL